MTTDIDHAAIETRIANDHGAAALQRMREAHERAATELARYEALYAAASSPADKANILNWAISYACTGIMQNLHIGFAADGQAKLHAVARALSAA